MTNTAPELNTSIEPPVEERISLRAVADSWEGVGACKGLKGDDMAYGDYACVGFNGLSRIAQEVQRKYCGPCPVQEACLAAAVINGDMEVGMVGGLDPKARETLHGYVDQETATIAKSIWNLAVDAVLDGEQAVFPGTRKHNKIPGEFIQSRIMDYLVTIPSKSMEAVEGVNVVDDLAEKLDLPAGAVKRNVEAMQQQGVVSKVHEGRRITHLSLVA